MQALGKSTLVKFIIQALAQEGVDAEKDVIFTSFTGKATQVLQKKGNKNVCTLHKLLYTFVPRANGTFFRQKVSAIPYKVVVVDECSMAPKELLHDLFEHNVYILCLGDPGQLPPINKEDDNHLLDNPHVFLDEVMRQAEESDIIKLSMLVREGKPIPYMKTSEVQVIKKEELNTGMLLWADQILCATNATRTAINCQVRDLLGRSEEPQDGDKVICLRNYWENLSEEKGNPLVNGTIGTLKNSFQGLRQIPFWMDVQPDNFIVLTSDFVTEDEDVFKGLDMDNKMILKGEPTLGWKESFKIGSIQHGKFKHLIPMDFTYGYAITTHKSQGSEWDKVLILEEKFPFDQEEHKRWLYTAITRSAKKVVLVRKG